MYEGNTAQLQMTRMVLEDGFFDTAEYPCRVVTYNPDEETIYLESGETELPVFSLDSLYRLTIVDKKSCTECYGFIRERYWNKVGRVLVFQIKNGFYKKVIN